MATDRFLSEADQPSAQIALQNMRMSCDSTYLLDYQTDSGAKADEFLTLLGEVLEQPGTKVVVFSQWPRMHELLVRRLEAQGIEYVLFHGASRARAARRSSTAFETTRAAGSSWPQTPAGWA